MAQPDLKLLQTMVQRVLDGQRAMRDDHRALREYLDVQFAMVRSRDFRVEGHDVEIRAIETLFAGHERRIAALEARQPAE